MHNKSEETSLWNDQYSMIGKFVVTFEETVNLIRFTLQLILQQQGLKTFSLSAIIFEQKQFTAEPLISCFESITNEILKQKDESKDILKRISDFRKKFSKIIIIRNDLLHGTYHFGENHLFIGGEIPDDYFGITKGSPNKEGARKKQIANKKEDVEKYLEELKKVRNEFWNLKFELLRHLYKK